MDDAHIKMSCHYHAAEDFGLQIEMNEINRSRLAEDEVLPYQEDELEETENKKYKLLGGKRFHLTAARAYWYHMVKAEK